MAVCFVLPLHPKHNILARETIDFLTLQKDPPNLFIVFSNIKERDDFARADDEQLHFLHFIITTANPNNGMLSPISYKKWFALHYIFNNFPDQHDFAIIIDAEIKFVKENFHVAHIYERCQYIFENKKYYGGRPNKGIFGEALGKINHDSLNIFKSQDNNNESIQRVLYETDNLDIYIWYSDLNVYKMSNLPHFLNCIKYDDDIGFRISYETFDYLVYQFYNIIFHDFKVVDTTELIEFKWSLEMFYPSSTDTLQRLENNGYRFSFVWYYAFIDQNLREWFIQHGVFLLYHTDRCNRIPWT